jgi:hypothetical protein
VLEFAVQGIDRGRPASTLFASKENVTKKNLLCIAVLFLLASVANAVTFTVDCTKPAPWGKVSTYLKMLNPQGPNTLKINGTCHENIVIKGFDRLSLIAKPGAVLEDGSNGQAAVIDIVDSTHVVIQGFVIEGGSPGVMCEDASLCRFNANVFENSAWRGVFIWQSEANFSGDTIQDAGDVGLAVASGSRAFIYALTVQRSASTGIQLNGDSFIEGGRMVVQNNGGDGITINAHSNLNLSGSTVTGNAWNGLDLDGHSAAGALPEHHHWQHFFWNNGKEPVLGRPSEQRLVL